MPLLPSDSHVCLDVLETGVTVVYGELLLRPHHLVPVVWVLVLVLRVLAALSAVPARRPLSLLGQVVQLLHDLVHLSVNRGPVLAPDSLLPLLQRLLLDSSQHCVLLSWLASKIFLAVGIVQQTSL